MKRINLLINNKAYERLDEIKKANKDLPIRLTKALILDVAINRLYKDLANINMEAIVSDYIAEDIIAASNETPTIIRNNERVKFFSNDGGANNE